MAFPLLALLFGSGAGAGAAGAGAAGAGAGTAAAGTAAAKAALPAVAKTAAQGMVGAGALKTPSMLSKLGSLGPLTLGVKGAANNPTAGTMLSNLAQSVGNPSNEAMMSMAFQNMGGVPTLLNQLNRTKSVHKPAPSLPLPLPQTATLNPFLYGAIPQRQAGLRNLGLRMRY